MDVSRVLIENRNSGHAEVDNVGDENTNLEKMMATALILEIDRSGGCAKIGSICRSLQ